ncbi:NADH dehydrogenase [ubiquinone] 1 alpha subcomplex assembly factor 3 [Xylocopa sonorina]|uniref:NADH dehydrogenase [ubiquinone] 1 alpha subcomplex assembly factor 3 n=1 Tax=Xylocopa sonorina TaxID=1818115 RepID=UPI00403B08C3
MILTKRLFALRQLLQNASCRQFSNSAIKKGYEGSGKTTVNIINLASDVSYQGQILISKCLPIGFKLSNDSVVLGPLAICSNALLSWNVSSAKDINEKTLSLFIALHPTLDLVVLGLETNYEYKKTLEMRKHLIEHNIKVEILPVHQACGIYNFLASEGRYVAAGLIPPLEEENDFWKNKTPEAETKQITSE